MKPPEEEIPLITLQRVDREQEANVLDALFFMKRERKRSDGKTTGFHLKSMEVFHFSF